MVRRTLILGSLLVSTLFTVGADRLKFRAAKPRPVADTYFGTTITDPYQWLEEDNNAEVSKWIEKQDERTRRWLERETPRDAIRQTLASWDRQTSADYTNLVDTPAGLFAEVTSSDKARSCIVRLASVDDPAGAVVIVDPTVMDPSGATTIDWWRPSPSGHWVAASLSVGGSQDGTLHFFDATNGTCLPDQLLHVHSSTGGGSVTWTSDEKAVHYTRYGSSGEEAHLDGQLHPIIYRHELGTDPAQDTYAVGKEFPRCASIELSTTPDAAFTMARVSEGEGGAAAYFWKVEGGPWEQFAKPEDRIAKAVLGDDGMVYVLTRQGAPQGRVLSLPLDHPDPDSGLEIAKAHDGELRSVSVYDGRLYVSESVGGPSRLHLYSTNGASSREVVLPELTHVAALVPRLDGTLLLRLQRFIEPPAWYVFNPTRSTLRKTALAVTTPVTFADIRVEHLKAQARDGVEIPLTLLVPASVDSGTPAPVLLQVEGAHGATHDPEFTSARRLWFDAGGIIAIAHVRGGGDAGPAWQKAASGAKKGTTFSDFEQCARYLIAKGRTTADHLAIEGSGAGGLATGVALTQTPDLFRAVVAHGGSHDALRAERTAGGMFDAPEFGSVRVRAQFEAINAWSPYHHVSAKTAYPAVLLTVGMNDTRVAPWHSFKMAARLQAATTSRHPVLLRVDPESGGAQSGTHEAQLDETADTLAFLFAELGLTVAGPK